MLYCEKCNVKIQGCRTECPLCQNVLDQSNDCTDEIFPVVLTTFHAHKLYFKILIFITIIGVVSSIGVNILLPQTGFWSLLVLLGAVYIWIAVGITIRKKSNIVKKIFYQGVMILLVAVLLDIFFDLNAWSLNYILPCLCVGMMASIAILAKIMKLPIVQFFTYLIIVCIFGIVPSILILVNIVDVLYPSVICVGCSIISLSALFLFEGNNIIIELKRRFHL
jgi:hypothetical protein